jgi:hypothetical protein
MQPVVVGAARDARRVTDDARHGARTSHALCCRADFPDGQCFTRCEGIGRLRVSVLGAWAPGYTAAMATRCGLQPLSLDRDPPSGRPRADCYPRGRARLLQLAPLDQQLREYAQAPARLPGADAPLRNWAADIGHDPRRTRRRAPLQLIARGRSLLRPGHHRPPVRHRRAPGRLSRQGPAALRWALFEAAQCARRRGSPDHAYYCETAAQLGGNRACMAIARKLAQAQLPHAARTRRGGAAARMNEGRRAQPSLTPMHRGRLPLRQAGFHGRRERLLSSARRRRNAQLASHVSLYVNRPRRGARAGVDC